MSLEEKRLMLPARHAQLEEASNQIEQLLLPAPEWADEIFSIQLGVHEACANVVDHAYGNNGEQTYTVLLQLDGVNGRFCATVTDQGAPYTPNEIATINAPLWQRLLHDDGCPLFRLLAVSEPDVEQARGRGLFLMKSLLDDIVYYRRGDSNFWQLTKTLPKDQA